MDLVFRALGAAAAANNALGRYRVNFIPSNFILAAVATAVLVFNVSGWMEAAENGTNPQTVRLQDVSSGGSPTFIRTSGVFLPGAGFQYGEQDDNGNIKKVTMEFVPLVDRESGRGLFVQLPPRHRFGTADRSIEITGMLRPMQAFLARELQNTNYSYEGVQILPGSVLVADRTPGQTASWQSGAVLSGVVVGVFLLLMAKRNTIFIRGAAVADAAADSAGGPAEMRATGTFHLDKEKRRFIDMPAILGPLDNGDLAALANVDASSSYMGMTYKTLSGIWIMPIAAGSIQGVEEGALYYGLRARPAVRFQYRESGSNVTRTAVLAVPSAAARQMLVGQLFAVRASV